MSRRITVASADALPPGQRKLAFVDGRSIVVFNVAGTLHAVENSCPHNGASLAGGRLDGSVLQCPAHGLRFDLTTGCTPGAGGLCLKTYAVQELDGQVVVQLDDA
ncbi:Rieske (2Fe-2S) protein [Ralstonia sp. UBA689]|uniref:Rieske (2Fe-2S) protein n=1 Tax=Ralstonia sp. UBA689 TaxID=1947373 RepID=UPI0025D9FD6A|nr:Rieske 2Fe-2S domain-containing protein [Ralstonia sp. UBA689]